VGARRHHEIVATIGNKLDVMMLPKVEGAWDIHYLDQLSPSSKPAFSQKAILIHPFWKPRKAQQCRTVAAASPRMHGMSLGLPTSPPRAA